MISVEKANEIILNNCIDFGTEVIGINNANGRILKENIFADRDFPPYNRICMDGIAIHFEAFNKGQRLFTIEKMQAAGQEQSTLDNEANCIEVMTGATMPINTTTVIRYEDLQKKDDAFQINIEVKDKSNIHYKGSDINCGEILLEKNNMIGSAEVAVLATVGKHEFLVAKLPKIAILSTGNELVEINQKPLAHQIRKSNVLMLKNELKNLNIDADTYHINDDEKEIEQKLADLINKYDVILMSGGVSMGKFDFIPSVLEKLKVKKLFHKITQRPGKPFWFGRKKNTTVFAFPGNPVSTFVCFKYYFENWLNKSLQLKNKKNKFYKLKESFSFKPDLTYFAQATLENINGEIKAKIKTGKGSGDMVSLLEADGFVILPKGNVSYEKEGLYEYVSYRH